MVALSRESAESRRACNSYQSLRTNRTELPITEDVLQRVHRLALTKPTYHPDAPIFQFKWASNNPIVDDFEDNFKTIHCASFPITTTTLATTTMITLAARMMMKKKKKKKTNMNEKKKLNKKNKKMRMPKSNASALTTIH